MEREKEAIIQTYTITLGANEKGDIIITPPTDKLIVIDYIIWDNGSGDFLIQNTNIKHWNQNHFYLHGSTLNQLLYLRPKGIVQRDGASIRVQNMTEAEDHLNLTIVGYTS